MRIAYLCQYFVPEIGAPSARVSEMARVWADLGHEVTVITGLPNHPTGIVPPAYRGTIFRRERLDGIHVWRNWLFTTPNEGFFKKTLSHLSFMASTLVLSAPRLRPHDLIVVSSPTLFSVISAFLMSRIWRIPYIFEVRDLWPGTFRELGVLKSGLLLGALEAIEMFLYRHAARVVVVTESFADILRGRGVPAAKLVTITNGVDGSFFTPRERENQVQREHHLSDKFVVLYIGAHGISQALTRLLDAASALRDDADIVFVFVGEGAEKTALVERAGQLGLGNVKFLPAQPKAAMPNWYAAADVVLVPLRDVPIFESYIPSKMFEVMASGRPIVASVRGEARRILERSGSALTVEPEDASGIAAAIRRLKSDARLARQMGENGRRFVLEHYDRSELARRYLEVLRRACEPARGPSACKEIPVGQGISQCSRGPTPTRSRLAASRSAWAAGASPAVPGKPKGLPHP